MPSSRQLGSFAPNRRASFARCGARRRLRQLDLGFSRFRQAPRDERPVGDRFIPWRVESVTLQRSGQIAPSGRIGCNAFCPGAQTLGIWDFAVAAGAPDGGKRAPPHAVAATPASRRSRRSGQDRSGPSQSRLSCGRSRYDVNRRPAVRPKCATSSSIPARRGRARCRSALSARIRQP